MDWMEKRMIFRLIVYVFIVIILLATNFWQIIEIMFWCGIVFIFFLSAPRLSLDDGGRDDGGRDDVDDGGGVGWWWRRWLRW